jgi:HK97 family phage major capsid protein
MEEKQIQELTTGIENVTKYIEGLQKEVAEGKASSEAAAKEMKALAEKQSEMARELTEMKQQRDAQEEAGAVKSVGAQFIESEAFKNYKSSRNAKVEVKDISPFSTQAGNSISRTTIAAPYHAGLVLNPEEDLTVEQLFPHVSIATSSIDYVKEGTFTNNAAVVAEGAKKPESTLGVSLATANVVTVAHFMKVTKQVYDDNPQAIMGLIDHKLRYGLQSVIDKQLIQGTGSGELGGLLLAGNHTEYPVALGNKDTLFDLVFKYYTAMASAGVAAKRIILNPADWAELALAKDTQGRYILGGPAAVAGKVLWGIPVETTNSMPTGKFIIGDLQRGATIYDRQALQVAMTESDKDDFEYNLITIRVERRVAFAVEQPLAIGGGDFTLGGSSK